MSRLSMQCSHGKPMAVECLACAALFRAERNRDQELAWLRVENERLMRRLAEVCGDAE